MVLLVHLQSFHILSQVRCLPGHSWHALVLLVFWPAEHERRILVLRPRVFNLFSLGLPGFQIDIDHPSHMR